MVVPEDEVTIGVPVNAPNDAGAVMVTVLVVTSASKPANVIFVLSAEASDRTQLLPPEFLQFDDAAAVESNISVAPTLILDTLLVVVALVTVITTVAPLGAVISFPGYRAILYVLLLTVSSIRLALQSVRAALLHQRSLAG